MLHPARNKFSGQEHRIFPRQGIDLYNEKFVLSGENECILPYLENLLYLKK